MHFAFRSPFSSFAWARRAVFAGDVDKSERFEGSESRGDRFARPTRPQLEHAVGEPNGMVISVPSECAANEHYQDTKLSVTEFRHQLVDHNVGCLGPGCLFGGP
jgi:hypothetical protein